MNYHCGHGRARWLPYLLLLPGIFFYLLISLGPSLATAVYSFTDATGIRGAPINWVGLENYREFLFMGQASLDNYSACLLYTSPSPRDRTRSRMPSSA